MKRGKRDLSTILEERLLEFRDLLASGAAFSALTRLGEIQLTLPTLGSADRARWDGILSEVALPQALLSGNSSDMEANLERLRRISESDGDLQFEEVCLVLSLRWKVKCAVA